MTRIVGTPRNRSVYITAIARKGKNTGPGSPRSSAIRSAATRISASAIRKILMLTRKARAISGNESTKICPSKNAFLTAGQPAELTTAKTTTAATTSVLASAMATPLRPPPFRSARIREPRPGSAPTLTPRALLQDGSVGLGGEPLVLEAGERPVCLQRRECLVHAWDQRAPLFRDRPEVLL